ncbi:MAG TPA: hypothetical protein VL486_03550 [Verrucomicrobiae bacterium]|nr:hypothetical protein [Verrucomicrobiae bacterium]
MTSPEHMSPVEITMLVGGTVLFVVALGLLVFCVVKRRSFKLVLALFPLAIIMIGFPNIKSAKVAGFEFDAKTADDFGNDPNSASTRKKFVAELNKLDAAHAATPARPLSPQVHSTLAAMVTKLDRQPNLSPESRATLARTELLLGQTNQAVASLHSALKVDTNLVVDPKLRILMRPISH